MMLKMKTNQQTCSGSADGSEWMPQAVKDREESERGQ
jgi:hypothetical protein